MGSPVVLTFTPDGVGHGLYTDGLQLADIGRLRIQRATTIEFDEKGQYWQVRDLEGFPLYNAPSRQACIAWEHQHLESQEDIKHGQRGLSSFT